MPRENSAGSVPALIAQALSPRYLRGLGRMRLSVRDAVGARPGNTALRRHTQPSGLEIERHKHYHAGDELRFVDWNVYARLDQLHVRRFRAEREAPLHILIDSSASMGTPAEDRKFSFSVGLALSLAYIALRHHDPVRIAAVGEQDRTAGFVASPSVRLPPMLQRLADFCTRLQPRGPTLLDRSIESYVKQTRGKGLVVVLSDFLMELGRWRDALRCLRSRGFEVAALRLLGDGEREPLHLFRRARLRDAEDGGERRVSLTPRNLQLYRTALDSHLEGIREPCRRHGAFFAVCDTAKSLEDYMSRTLPRSGLLR